MHDLLLHEGTPAAAEQMAALLAPGLIAGMATIVIATPQHRRAIREALTAAGHERSLAASTGRYVEFDATTTLEQILHGTTPDPDRLEALWAEMLTHVGDRPVQLYGEMVATCMELDLPDAAITLETLWNDLATDSDFDLYCGYPIHAFNGDADPILTTICSQHRATTPSPSQTREPCWR